jgi:hypothetical protein
MSPRHLFILALTCFMLTGCTKAQDTASQGLDTVGTEAGASYNKMRDLLDVGTKPKPVVAKKVQQRYCYKTYEDIICYSKLLPGEEYRLVGFQTEGGKTGYVMDPAVPGGDAEGNLPPLKTVTVTTPPTIKGDDSNLKEIIFDPAELEPRELVPEKPQ